MYAHKLGVSRDVIFLGWERDIPSIYADLDILALTSQNEGTPVSIIEAMASGVPVITTGVGGVKDLLGNIEYEIQNGDPYSICERGIVCPKNNPIGFANGIQFIINDQLSGNSNRICCARDFVLQFYSEQVLITNTERLYIQLVNEH